jgi:transposase
MPTSVCWNCCRKPVNSQSFPPKPIANSSAPYDKELYKTRHLIENFFAKLKLFRAIATRYDKTARNFLAAIHLAAVSIWLI